MPVGWISVPSFILSVRRPVCVGPVCVGVVFIGAVCIDPVSFSQPARCHSSKHWTRDRRSKVCHPSGIVLEGHVVPHRRAGRQDIHRSRQQLKGGGVRSIAFYTGRVRPGDQGGPTWDTHHPRFSTRPDGEPPIPQGAKKSPNREGVGDGFEPSGALTSWRFILSPIQNWPTTSWHVGGAPKQRRNHCAPLRSGHIGVTPPSRHDVTTR